MPDAKLVDMAGDLAPDLDVVGTIRCPRGAVVIKGYLNKPEVTASADPGNGWL